MIQKRLDEIKARYVASTPGEWIDKLCESQGDDCWCRWIDAPPYDDESSVVITGCLGKADAIFCANAHQDVPYLLERLQEAQTKIVELEQKR